jgi:hypothetical protein
MIDNFTRMRARSSESQSVYCILVYQFFIPVVFGGPGMPIFGLRFLHILYMSRADFYDLSTEKSICSKNSVKII